MRHSKFPKGCIQDTVDIYESSGYYFYCSLVPKNMYIYPSMRLTSTSIMYCAAHMSDMLSCRPLKNMLLMAVDFNTPF